MKKPPLGVTILPEVLAQLGGEWDAARCAICEAAKWKKFPFCRSCSIRAIRVGIMRELRGVAGMSSKEIFALSEQQAQRRGFLYDRARDFVHTSRRFPVSREVEE